MFNLPREGGEETGTGCLQMQEAPGGQRKFSQPCQILSGAAGHGLLPLGLTPASAAADRRARQRDYVSMETVRVRCRLTQQRRLSQGSSRVTGADESAVWG